MTKLTIPIILSLTIIAAGFFAFSPIEQASSVHTTILAGSTDISETLNESDTAGDDFTITCPAASDGCHILDVYLTDPGVDQGNTDAGVVTLTVNGVALQLSADATAAFDNGAAVVGGVSGVALGNGDSILIAMAPGGENNPTLIVIATVEGGEDIEVTSE